MAVLPPALALMIVIVGFFIVAGVWDRQRLVEELEWEADLIGAAAVPSLLMADSEAARGALDLFNADDRIAQARIFDAHGRLFAVVGNEPSGGLTFEKFVTPGTYRENGSLLVARPVMARSNRIGTIVVSTQVARVPFGSWVYGLAAGVVVVLALFVAAAVAMVLVRPISKPVLILSDSRNSSPSKGRTFSEVTGRGENQLGYLVDNFNDMVSQIEERDRELVTVNQRLEILNSMWREIAAVRSTRTVVEAVLARLVDVLPCDYACVALADQQSSSPGIFVDAGEGWFGSDDDDQFPLAQAWDESGTGGGDLCYCADTSARDKGCSWIWNSGGRRTGACVCAPISAERDRIGELFVLVRKADAFNARDLELIREVAGGIGVALHQARLQDELAVHEHRLQALVDNLPEGVVWLDEDCRVTLTNSHGGEFLRLIAQAGVGDVVERLAGIPVEAVTSAPEEGRIRQANLETDEKRSFEIGIVELSGDLRDPGGFIIVIRELTRELHDQKQLQLQARLASVGQLAAGIAHDFNNMLQAVAGFAELIQAESGLPEEVAEWAQGIRTQGRRGAELVRQILDFSRTSVSDRRPLRLNLAINETMAMLESIITEKVQVRTEIWPGDYVVVADPIQIQQVLVNLAVNARDAMPGGGELVIKLDRVVFEDNDFKPFPQMEVGEWIRVTVRDNGAGMEPGVAARVFEPFFTTKDPSEGTGLGLAQVYGIVKQHQGFIDVETVPGGGTAFLVYLPVSMAEVVSKSVDDVPARTGNGELILIVEDEKPVRDVIHEMIEKLGYEAVTARSGSEALQVFERFRQEIELVVSDLMLPGMGGVEVVQRLREESPGLPVVLTSGYSPGDEARSELAKPLTEWIAKPFSSDQMARAIARVRNSI